MIDAELAPHQVQLVLQCDTATYIRWVNRGLLPRGFVPSHIVHGFQQLIEENTENNISLEEAAIILSKASVTILNWESRGIITRVKSDHRKGVYFKKKDILQIKNTNNQHANSLQCKKCKCVDKLIAFGYCEQCYKNTKYKDTLEKYTNGETLQKIGDEYGVSRERARQLIQKALSMEEKFSHAPDSAIVWSKIKLDHKKTGHSRHEWYKNLSQNRNEVLDSARTYRSLRSFMIDFNIPASAVEILKTEFPEIYNAIKPRWSTQYDACKMCGTTAVSHKMYGCCKNCYYKTDQFKAVQRKSRLRNREKLKNKG